MDLQAAMLDAARHRTGAPTSVSQGQPLRPQQLGVGDRRRCLPPRPPPPPSRGDTRSGGVGKADEVRGTRDTCRGTGVAVATREAAPAPAPVAADAAAVAAHDAAPGVARPDKGKGVAELGGKRCLDLAEEKRGGDAERKRGLGLAAYPPPKRRLVSATRRFPPGCGRARVASAAPCYATSTDRAAQEEFVTLHEPVACRDGPSVPATSLRSQEKRPSCVVAKDIKVVKSAGSSSNAHAQSLAEGPSKENLVSAKMGTAISGVGASGQGAMRRDKVMSAPRKEVRPAESIQKSAPGFHPSPRPFSKIKEKETEHGRCVTTNDSEDTAGFAKRRVVQASTSGNKFLRTEREAAATSSNSFGPRKKGNVKQKSMLPSNVEDDILKALAAHEEKYGAQNVDARSKVKMMRRRFEFLRKAIIRAVKQQSLKLPRIDLAAADLIKKMPGFTQQGPIVGNVLGIEIGDEFLYRVELNIVGLHRPYQGGIDTTRDKYNELIAISVVASGGYPDQLSRSGELIYTGSGGKISGKKGEGDQKLVKGNLGLKNCIRKKTPVRVIHSFKGLYQGEGNHSSAKEASIFTYDGLYNVVDCWREGQPGSKVFKYKLQKIPGQLHLR